MKFLKCKHCGNIITFLNDKGVIPICCGEKMEELAAGSVDASMEKHVPVYHKEGNKVVVEVGSVIHPMIEEHYIQWIILVTKSRTQIAYLKPNNSPKAEFLIDEEDEVLEVYEYCNLHGLWKK